MTHSPAIRRRAVALYRKGKTSREVAGILGIGACTVTRWARESGIETRPRLPAEAKAVIVRRYVTGESSITLGDEYGISGTTVIRLVRAAGHSVRPRAGRKASHTEAEAVEAVRKYGTVVDAAYVLGIQASALYEFLKRRGLRPHDPEGRYGSSGNRWSEAEKASAVAMYVEGAPMLQIEASTGASRTTIRRWAERAGASIRLPGRAAA